MKEFILPEKPKYGSPCNNCGVCCHLELCSIGKEVFGENQESPCPALMQLTDRKTRETKLVCHFVMVEKASGLSPVLQEALGIGKGCCAED